MEMREESKNDAVAVENQASGGGGDIKTPHQLTPQLSHDIYADVLEYLANTKTTMRREGKRLGIMNHYLAQAIVSEYGITLDSAMGVLLKMKDGGLIETGDELLCIDREVYYNIFGLTHNGWEYLWDARSYTDDAKRHRKFVDATLKNTQEIERESDDKDARLKERDREIREIKAKLSKESPIARNDQ